MNPPNDRPVLDQAKRKSLIVLGGTLISAALSFGIVSPELADKLNSAWAYLLGAVITVLPLITSALHALGIVHGAEPKTTPVDSPQDHAGNPLVPVQSLDADTYGNHAAPADTPAVYAEHITNPATAPIYTDQLDEMASANGLE